MAVLRQKSPRASTPNQSRLPTRDETLAERADISWLKRRRLSNIGSAPMNVHDGAALAKKKIASALDCA
jgi:hypothetical protein